LPEEVAEKRESQPLIPRDKSRTFMSSQLIKEEIDQEPKTEEEVLVPSRRSHYTLKFMKHKIDLMADVNQSAIAAWNILLLSATYSNICSLEFTLNSGDYIQKWTLSVDFAQVISSFLSGALSV
jgi:hypothetical protein